MNHKFIIKSSVKIRGSKTMLLKKKLKYLNFEKKQKKIYVQKKQIKSSIK